MFTNLANELGPHPALMQLYYDCIPVKSSLWSIKVNFGTNSLLEKNVPTHSTEHNHLKIASGEVTRWS